MANTFHRSMTTEELVDWLLAKGLSHKECDILSEEEFTGESFLLLDRQTMQDLEIKRGGQILLLKLLEEVRNGNEENEVERGDDIDDGNCERAEVVPYCTHIPEECPLKSLPDYDPGCRQSDSAGAYILKDKIWDDRDVVKVYFINPELLHKWGLTTKDIMQWAGVWSCDDKVPNFEETSRAKMADVRVEFSEKSACWSHVGKCAVTVKHPKPTMVLNLQKHKPEMQRSLVIHEFGHALGLEHEHQRSDFWNVMKDLLDKKKMERDISRRMSVSSSSQKAAGYQIQYYEKEEEANVSKSEYDPESIMHYWFDTDWLKDPRHSRLGGVTKDYSLTKEQKKYLIGIQKRQRTDPLAKDPSEKDLAQLKEVYGSQCTVRAGLKLIASP